LDKKIKHLLVIEGATASGKTAVSVELAKYFSTAVVSADSRQFYKEIGIGTAKPTAEEQCGVEHFFIDSHTLSDEVSAAKYEEEALQMLNKLFKSHDVVVLTGGSGMFIDALCIGLDPIPADKNLRNKITHEFEEQGLDKLLNELKEKDPDYWQEVDRNNPVRVIRAIEAIRITDLPYSSLRVNSVAQRDFVVHRYVLNHNRELLYERINKRVDLMVEQGLLEEVKSVHHLAHLSSLNTVGYKELFEHLNGKTTIEAAIEKIKMNTRRYAKRQLTWFRRHPESIWIEYTDKESVIQQIISDFKMKSID
jgi:tRNA dimethylallyltransferase